MKVRITLLAASFLLSPLIAFANLIAIGTVEHPTIDGAFIRENIEPATPPSEEPVKKKVRDAWVNDKQLRNKLIAATRDGKLDYVLKKTQKLGLPATVALLPMIESNYSTKAVSNKGAEGAWQLMPQTAKAYGLSAGKSFEFTASTDAALHLLTDLYHQFGNWELAFAAYNAGSGRIQKALKQAPNAESVVDLSIPTETKHYIARLTQLNNLLAGLS